MANDELVGNMNTEFMIAYLEKEGWQLNLNKSALQQSLQMAGEIFI